MEEAQPVPEWPKTMYKRGHEPTLVLDADHLKAMGFGWTETPETDE